MLTLPGNALFSLNLSADQRGVPREREFTMAIKMIGIEVE